MYINLSINNLLSVAKFPMVNAELPTTVSLSEINIFRRLLRAKIADLKLVRICIFIR